MAFDWQLAFLAVALRAVLAFGLDCGTWATEECLGDTDIRFKESASTNLEDLHPLYKRVGGYWKGTFQGYDGNKEREQPGFAFLRPDVRGGGMPYNTTADVFWQISLSGSRFHQHDLYVYPPVDAAFCSIPVPQNFTNVIGNGLCGTTGYAAAADIFRTSTHEKDKVSVTILATGIYRPAPGTVSESSFMPVGDQVFYGSGGSSGMFFNTNTWVFSTDFNSMEVSTQTYFFIMGRPITLVGETHGSLIRVTETEWISAISASYAANNVPQALRIQVPVEGCMVPPCPTEEHWCKTDPSCSESPYKEKVTIKASIVAAFTVSGAVLLITCVVAFFQWRIFKIKKVAKGKFSKRIAQGLGGFTGNLTHEQLAKEFQSIDNGDDDGGNGLISKEEMWAYLNSKGDTDMTKKEFDVLFREVDKDRSGQIDFVEFCGFLCELQKNSQPKGEKPTEDDKNKNSQAKGVELTEGDKDV